MFLSYLDKCVSHDYLCNQYYPNTYAESIDVDGKPVCNCKEGYISNYDGTACY